MKIGLFGLPKSGKTTLFNALTKSEAPVSAYASSKAEPNIAIVKVSDERVKRLSEMYKPKKTVFATIEIVDVAGIAEDSIRQEAFAGEMLKVIRNADSLAFVIRGFANDITGPADPIGDLRKIEEETLLSDLIIAEKRLEKIRAGYTKGQKNDALQMEEKVLERVYEQLNKSEPVRKLEFSPEEELVIRGFQFLTKKPAIVILNTDEVSYGKNEAVMQEFSKEYNAIEFAGNFEMELSRLDENDAQMFMEDMGIKESAKDRLTKIAYDTLGYISFFTVGADEVRAWNIRRGSTAVEAAGSIHSDLARGFIAAECFSYEDLMELGSEKAVKEKGRFHLEGKDYIVSDGDIMSIRFNV
ncbi:MAG TPA: redox-regulated ATPase YchF [Chitinispirillaceae bacterium]|jgi:GTP-binding protein YchF|nr:redox-regulated ATPase YchF [Chitinispirillaceae bacterium]